jgi:LPXTG-motif cell wall-anchored protein
MRAIWIPFTVALGEGHGRRFFVDFGFPDFPVTNGPMLRGRSPVEVRAPKYFHATYKPPKQEAGEDSFSWVVMGGVIFAVSGAGFFLKNRRKNETQSAVMKEAWAWVASILPSLEKAAEKMLQAKDLNRLAQLEAEVHKFEQVLDSLDVPALVEGGVFESEEAVKKVRKDMLARTEVLLERISDAFPEEVPEEQPVQGAGALTG